MCNGRGLCKVYGLLLPLIIAKCFECFRQFGFVWSNLEASDLWPVQLGSSTSLLALYSTDYWFPFKMWRLSHSDHNLLINVSCSSSPAVVITTIRGNWTLKNYFSLRLSLSVPFPLPRVSFCSSHMYVCVFTASCQGKINISLVAAERRDHLYLREKVGCGCSRHRGQYCNLAALNHTMAASVAANL